MKSSIKIIENGSISSPKGFRSGAIFAGIKTPGEDKKDIGILFSDEPCTVAGTYSQNSILSPSVTLTKQRVNSDRKIRGLVANSGCANCSVGEQGYLDAKETTNITAKFLNVDDEEILDIRLPAHVNLDVDETEPGVKGNTATGATKPARLESGLTVQVPLFINEGDQIKIDTRSGEYIERVKS